MSRWNVQLATADRILVEGRDRVKRIRAEDLTRSDVTEALEAVAADLNHKQRVRFALSVEGRLEGVASPVLHELFYIGQEAITNAFRHSKASEIAVKLTCRPKSVVLVVSDNGCGLDLIVQQANPHTVHWGSPVRKERAEAVGAQFECHSAANQGSEVVVTGLARRAYRKRLAPGTAKGHHLAIHSSWLERNYGYERRQINTAAGG